MKVEWETDPSHRASQVMLCDTVSVELVSNLKPVPFCMVIPVSLLQESWPWKSSYFARPHSIVAHDIGIHR
jgi:hypothetical protein